MIRMVLALLLIIAIFIGLVMFPDIATLPVRIELVGWLFETRTGMFVMLLVSAYSVWWTIKLIFNLSINSPKQLWSSLRSGNFKRREHHLQDALATWVDAGEGHSLKLLKRSKNVVPAWLYDVLLIWWGNVDTATLTIHDEKDAPMIIALKARLATNPEQIGKFSISERQHFLESWLAVHPAAPLALQRKAVLLGEIGDFSAQVELYETLWNSKQHGQTISTLFAEALRQAAKINHEYRLPHLRKAHRIDASNQAVIIDLAQALVDTGERKSGERMLLSYLETHDALDIAKAAYQLWRHDALAGLKMIDKPVFQSTMAGQWLRIKLAHQAKLTGIAEDGLQSLLSQNNHPEFWQMQGDWHAEKRDWQKAAESYQKALNR